MGSTDHPRGVAMTVNASGRPNRVAPDGSTHAVAGRGLFWGNRGRLLNARGEPVRHYQSRAWLICVLEFKGRQRTQWRPDRLTELYFLDEATALAAGHRPCGECRHHDYQRFKAAWADAHGPAGAPEMDRLLHADRLDGNRSDGNRHRTHDAALAGLPDGAMIDHGGRFWLLHGQRLHAWDFDGYPASRPPQDFPVTVTVRTPRATLDVLRAGYTPACHPSARA